MDGRQNRLRDVVGGSVISPPFPPMYSHSYLGAPGRCADASFEIVAEHSRASADAPFSGNAAGGRCDCLEHVLLVEVKGVDVIERAVVGLGDDWQHPAFGVAVVHSVLHQGIPDEAHLMGVGDADDQSQHSRFFYPGNAGHFAVSVKGKIAAKGVIVPNLTLTRYNYRDPGPGDAGLIVNESGVTYQGAGHVGDGVELSSGYTANG